MKNKKLTDKEKKFCKFYRLYGKNATKAARLAGYSEKTAKEIGSQNLTKLHIQDEIKRVSENIEETVCISKELIINEHIKLAFSSIAHLHNTWIERKEFEQLTDDQKACISEIMTRIQKKNIGTSVDPDIVDVEEIKIKLYDKQKSLDAISKLMGYDSAVKLEIEDKRKTVSDLFPSEEELQRKANELDKP